MKEKRNKIIKKLNTIKNNLNNFIYPDYPELQIYSKEYYRNIFLNLFNNKEEKYSYMYGDFNKIKKINDTFGNQAGDIALEIGHKLLRESFPKNVYISRIGGDEATVISPELDTEKTQIYINKLKSKLKEFSENLNNISISLTESKNNINNNLFFLNANLQSLLKIKEIYGQEAFDKSINKIQKYLKSTLPQNATITKIDPSHFSIILNQFLTPEQIKSYENELNNKLKALISPLCISITTSISDSTVANIRELEHITDQEVIKQKNSREIALLNKNENDPWEKLNILVKTAIDNHLADLRPSDKFIYEIKDYKKEIFFMIDTFIDALEKNIFLPKDTKDAEETYDISKELKEETDFESQDLIANSDIVSLVHLFLTNNVNLEAIDTKKLLQMDEFMTTLINYLTHNKNSGELNKFYLKHYLAKEICDKKCNLQVLVLSMLDIKANNTAYGHKVTDERILKTTSLLKELYSNKKFNKEAFTFSEDDSYFIDYNGGEILILLDKNQKTNQIELDKNLQYINNTYNPENPNSPLPIVGIVSDTLPTNSVDNFLQYIKTLKQKCSYKKDVIKKDTFDSMTKRISFKKSIEKPIQYYLREIGNATDIEQKKKFILTVFNNLLEHEAEYNSKSRENTGEKDLEY